MSAYTKRNLKQDVEDMAPRFGLSPGLASHFARVPLELEQSGVSLFTIAPGFRAPFGHVHAEQEEVYVVCAGSARVKLDDDVVELAQWDAVRIAPGTMRGIEGGPDGAELLAFGAPDTQNQDVEMVQDWWRDSSSRGAR
jgi:mannose-6-phosphate isomerase-like protein (cupin superfamily)